DRAGRAEDAERQPRGRLARQLPGGEAKALVDAGAVTLAVAEAVDDEWDDGPHEGRAQPEREQHAQDEQHLALLEHVAQVLDDAAASWPRAPRRSCRALARCQRRRILFPLV